MSCRRPSGSLLPPPTQSLCWWRHVSSALSQCSVHVRRAWNCVLPTAVSRLSTASIGCVLTPPMPLQSLSHPPAQLAAWHALFSPSSKLVGYPLHSTLQLGIISCNRKLRSCHQRPWSLARVSTCSLEWTFATPHSLYALL